MWLLFLTSYEHIGGIADCQVGPDPLGLVVIDGTDFQIVFGDAKRLLHLPQVGILRNDLFIIEAAESIDDYSFESVP